MNAPYDGERGDASDDAAPPQDPYAPGGPYQAEDSGRSGRAPYHRDPHGADPYGDEPYGAGAHGPDPRGSEYDAPGWGNGPAGGAGGPTGPSTVRLNTGPPQGGPAQGDAFAHLFRDQGGRSTQGPPQTPQHPQAPQAPQGPTGAGSGGPEAVSAPYAATPQRPDPDPATAPQSAVPTEPTLALGTKPPQTSPGVPPDVPGAPGAPDDGSGAPAGDPSAAAEAPSSGGGGKAGGLLKSSAIMAAGTMVSRLTGFVRSAMIVAALGGATLNDTYQLAITLPTMLYVLTVGGGLNSVFVPQLVRAMKEDGDGGEAYANRLLTLVTVILAPLAVLSVFAAPLLVRMMSVPIAGDPAANGIAVTFVRFCMPSIFFMGIHVVMGQILNARGRFGAMMWTPVLNNIVIMASVGCFLWVYGSAGSTDFDVHSIPPEGVRLLGVGTVLGLVVQALAMIPYLRATGFRIRPRFDWRGHGLGKAARLAKWTLLFVLANQAGNLVVSQLSTAAQHSLGSGHPGSGYSAYSQAQLIWNMPQSIITVSIMAALLPRISRAASDGDSGAVRDDISQGLRTSAVAIVPLAFGFLALGIPLCTLIFGSSGIESARSFGFSLMAFGVGLIPFSVQYVVLRGFYAYEDTRTPFFNTVIIAAANAVLSALCYFALPARWAVVGMAASYGLAYIVGVGVAWRRLRIRLGGDLDGSRVVRTYVRLAGAAIPATVVAGAVVYGITELLGSGTGGSLASVLLGGLALGAVFVVAAKRMRIAEMTAMVGMVRGRLGR